MFLGIEFVEWGLFFDWVIWIGICRLLEKWIKNEVIFDIEWSCENEFVLIEELKSGLFVVDMDVVND